MRQAGIHGKQTQLFRSTTRRNPEHPVAPNLLQRDFTAGRPDQIWLADITYIPTQEGWLYLAAVMDLCSRRIVGWAMDKRMTEDLTLAALQMALDTREPDPELIHYSDRGSQYTSMAIKGC
jgi:transposase InsO family protein